MSKHYKVYSSLRQAPLVCGVPWWVLIGMILVAGGGFFVWLQMISMIAGLVWIGICAFVYVFVMFLQTQDPMYMSILMMRFSSEFENEQSSYEDCSMKITWR